jgi:hypothetical protein
MTTLQPSPPTSAWRKLLFRSPRPLPPCQTRPFGLPRSVLMRLLMGGTTVAVSLSGYWCYQVVRNLILDGLKDTAFLEVQQGGDEIDTWLSNHKASLEASANNPTFRTMDWEVIEPYLQSEERRLP